MKKVSANLLILRAFALFHYFDTLLRFRSFESIYQRHVEARCEKGEEGSATGPLPAAFERRIVVLRRALRLVRKLDVRSRRDCLPRSLTMFSLLRSLGVPAHFRLGVRKVPFGAHAWVEVQGEVVSDFSDETSQYTPLQSPAALSIGEGAS